ALGIEEAPAPPPPRPDVPTDVAAGRRPAPDDAAVVELLLHRGALEEAASALCRLTDRGPGPALGPPAGQGGARCPAPGMVRAASDCYLAGWAADRLDARALWRLADLAVVADDFDLAVSYLEHVAAVLRWRGDARGLVRVYRKMTILAPDRDDVRE